MSSITSNASSPRPPGTKDAVTSEFQTVCERFFAEVVQIFGIPKSVGQIYGLLYASPRPLGFLDIVERLGISKGSASQGLHLLRNLGAINEARGQRQKRDEQGSRIRRRAGNGGDDESETRPGGSPAARVVYEPELSLRRLVSGVLRERIAPIARTSNERLTSLRSLAEEFGSEGEFYLTRAKQLNTWRRRFKAVLPVLIALLGPVRK